MVRRFFLRVSMAVIITAAPGTAVAFPTALPERGQEALEPHVSPLNGKTIRSIRVHVAEIFDDANQAFYRTVNNLKISTQEQVIRRELLFAEGEPYEEVRIRESERALRALRFLRRVEIVPQPDGDVVDIDVEVQDTWTLIPQAGFSLGTGSDSLQAGIAESNLFGLGKRVELLYRESENRETIEGVYDDNRVWGSHERLLVGGFHRDDGDRGVLFFGRPFRSLVEKESWFVNADVSDTVGRLFEDGDESFIYRQERTDLNVRYTFARGNPETRVERFSVGYAYSDDAFEQATLDDFEDLDLNPAEVSNDPSMLADDRRFTGPVLAYRSIVSDFLSTTYVDRFDRVLDYNLGPEFSASLFAAPKLVGSADDAVLFTLNQTYGRRFDAASFLRAELGGASRYRSGELEDSLVHFEAKYYNVLGPVRAGDLYLGKHTLAAHFLLDYGDDLDRDRQLTIGAGNGLRGYETRAFSGDKRLLLNFEDRMHFVDDAFKLVSVGAAAFMDIGAASDERFGNLFTDEVYSNVGVGLRFAFPRSTGGRVLRLDLAIPLRDGPDGSAQFEPRFIISGGQLFDAYLRSESSGPEAANVEVGVDQ